MFNARSKGTGYLFVVCILLALISYATYSIGATGQLMSNPNPQFFANKGAGNNMQACSGCALSFYQSGTTTPLNTYSDAALNTPNSNPLTLNSRGEAANQIFMNGTYTVVLRTSSGANTVIWSRDNVIGIGQSTVSGGGANTVSVWIDAGSVPTFIAGNSFSLPGDHRAHFVVDQRSIMTVTTGFKYGRVTSSSYALGVTTVTLNMDSGSSIDASLSAAGYSVMVPNLGYSLTFNHIDPSSTIDSTGAVNFSGTVTTKGSFNAARAAINGPLDVTGSANIASKVTASDVSAGNIISTTSATISAANFTGPVTTSSTVNFNAGFNSAYGDVSGAFNAGTINSSSITPTGTVVMYGAANAPAGWLNCDGSVVSQTTYSALYGVIGTTFNSGTEGAGNFRLPDFRGVFPKGAGNTTRAAGVDASGNAYSGTLGTYLQDKMQGHRHPYNDNTYNGNTPGGANSATLPSATTTDNPVTDGVNGTPRTGHTTEPQSLGINFIIKH